MKKNKAQQEITAARKRLYPGGFSVSTAFSKWAVSSIHLNAYCSGSNAWCPACGENFPHSARLVDNPDLNGDGYITCPHCGRRLTAVSSRKRTLKEVIYLQELTSCGRFQIVRTYVMEYEGRQGYKLWWYIMPIAEWWFGEQGEKACWRGQLKGFLMYCRNPWRKYGRLRPAVNLNSDYLSGWKIKGMVYPRRRLADWTRRAGLLNAVGYGIDYAEIVPVLQKKGSMCETILKWKDRDLLQWCMYTEGADAWPSIKVAHRHGWRDFGGDWFDYLDQLRELGYDVLSPKWLCPADLHKEHVRITCLVERQRQAKEAEKLKEEDKVFRKRIAPLMCLAFKVDAIEVRPLESISEFSLVGRTHKICVFANQYYAKTDSLILGVWDDGKYKATIEMDLKSFKIVQFRGPYNATSPYEKAVTGLIHDNLKLFKSARRKQLKIIKGEVS